MEEFLKVLIAEFGITQSKATDKAIEKLVDSNKIKALSDQITEVKQQIINLFVISKEKEEFKERHFIIENANAKKDYNFQLNLEDFPNIAITEIRNLDSLGLEFDPKEGRIFGKPVIAGSTDLHIVFFHKQDENLAEDIKVVPFIINSDPKDLWKNIASDPDSKWAKPDDVAEKGTFLDKKYVVASRRGRSHAHEGKFRDDHFCVKSLPQGWAIAAVADGAGSASYAREGSKIATEFLCEQFNNEELMVSLDGLLRNYFSPTENSLEITQETEVENLDGENSDDANSISETENIEPREPEPSEKPSLEKSAKSGIVNTLYKEVLNVHKKLNETAQENSLTLKDLNTTLIFTLVKKFEFGYAVLSFGVGDCPINIISADNQNVELLNMMDVGDFGGGTRFITMPEIFSNPNMGARFSINKYDDFSKLVLMTDGIYDPKFITENKLEDLNAWNIFLEDLDGKNEDLAKVDFKNDEDIENQLLKWMDFWNKGNHDDRTLAIIY